MALMIAASSAYGISVLILKRSVLTEKVARKGFHLTREYSVDPLEILFVREVMRTDFISFHAGALLSDAARPFIKGKAGGAAMRQRLPRDDREVRPRADHAERMRGRDRTEYCEAAGRHQTA